MRRLAADKQLEVRLTAVEMRHVVLLVLLIVGSCAGDSKYDPKYGRHNITMGQRRLYPQFPVDT